MELDLDSFLQSSITIDQDEDVESDYTPYRTVDDILNESDASLSSSPPPPATSNSSYIHHRRSTSNSAAHEEEEDDAIHGDKGSLQASGSFLGVGPMLGKDSTSALGYRTDVFKRLMSGYISDRRPSRASKSFQLNPGKPGVALAAATAASLTNPIFTQSDFKSRRDRTHLILKVSQSERSNSAGIDFQEIDGNDDSHQDTSSDVSHPDEKVKSVQNSGLVDLSKLEPTVEWSKASKTEDMPYEEKPRTLPSVDERTGSAISDNHTEVSSPHSGTSRMGSSMNLQENLDLFADSVLFGFNDKGYTFPTSEPNGSMENGESHSTKRGSFTGDVFNSDTDENKLSEVKNSEDYIRHKDKHEVVLSTHESTSRVDDLFSLWESKKGNKMVNKTAHQLDLLELAEEIEKKLAFTGLHWEEGAAAQPMRLEGVRGGLTVLGYFNIDADNAMTRMLSSHSFRNDCGSAQAIAVHPNFVAAGTSKGIIVIIPSRYDPYNVDAMDTKILMLRLQGERSHTGVTSMCFNQQGDLLLAGYFDGHVTVWDVLRTSPLKVISGEHSTPIVHTMFLGHSFQVPRQFKAITGDSKGLVLLHSFSVGRLLNRFSIETQCLFDGKKTGIVLSAVPLLSDEIGESNLAVSQGSSTSSSNLGTMMGGIVGSDSGWKLFGEGSSVFDEGVVIFVTYQTALVARLTPTLEVYAKLSRPDGAREGSIPYASWKSLKQAGNSSTGMEKASLLALGWDRKVLVANLAGSKLKIHTEWVLECATIGLMWLNDQMLVVLTSAGELCLFGKDGTLIHQTSYVVNIHEPDDTILYHTLFSNIYGNPEKAYHNCLSVRGTSVYVLGPMHLMVCRLLPWKERIMVLRSAGDWMGALNMAMTIFDGQAHGVFDIPRALECIHEAVVPFHIDLLLSYVDEVFSYISVAFGNQVGKLELVDVAEHDFVHSKIKEQYTRVGGVAVEFCIHIKRTDILFNEVFGRFVAVSQRDTFLELLEPYILRDMLGSLPPEIMQALVEYYNSKGWLDRVEQCVLHMDISSLDFNQVVKLCREHGLYGALIYLFNRGLDDFKAPLEELLNICLRNTNADRAVVLGYKLLVYLRYCFSGLAFPPGSGVLPESRLASLRAELVQFLLESPGMATGTRRSLHYFLELDTEATLEVLRNALVEHDSEKSGSSLHDSSDVHVNSNASSSFLNLVILVQNTVDALVAILDETSTRKENSSFCDSIGPEAWPTEVDKGHLFDFIAHYIACGKAHVAKVVLAQIFEHLTSPDPSVENSRKRADQVLAVLEVVPGIDWDGSSLLHLCEKAGFWKVCGLIHTLRQDYFDALESYMKDENEPVHAFSFISNMLLYMDREIDTFRSFVVSRVAELVNLSREGTLFMVMDNFMEERLRILEALRYHPKSLFLYLKTVIDVQLCGTLDFGSLRRGNSLKRPVGRNMADRLTDLSSYLDRLADFPKMLRKNPVYATNDMIELYLELLCQYERRSVLKFLRTFDSYKTEDCLRLCLEHGIIDASAFLLERVGDVGAALQLILSSLDDKFIKLDTSISNAVSSGYTLTILASQSMMPEVDDVLVLLRECVGLCQRNTHGLDPKESDCLWFRLLDSFCEPLVDKYNSSINLGEDSGGFSCTRLDRKAGEVSSVIRWKISKTNSGAPVLKKLFSRFIREIVEGMIGYVHLPEIMSKLLSDSGQEFGDFKLTIMAILGTYGFERKILETAKFLIEDDTCYTLSLLRKGTSRGHAPRDPCCCICRCSFHKNSSNLGLRIFSCSHAVHLQCDPENGSSSHVSSTGCPICTRTQNVQKGKNKSASAQTSLISGSQPGKAPSGTHLHDINLQENCHYHQLSRFEILTKLGKGGRMGIENGPQLKLAPPALYHEKVKKGFAVMRGESSSHTGTSEESNKLSQLDHTQMKSTKTHFPLKSSILRLMKS